MKVKVHNNYVYSRDNLSKTKDGAYIVNLNGDNVTYFESFRVQHFPKEMKKVIGNQSIITNIYRIQKYDSIMCGYICIGFIDFMLKRKSLLEFFSLNKYEKNEKVILKYFQ